MNDLETVQGCSRAKASVIRRRFRLARASSACFVLGTWLILTLIAFWFVAKYGNRTPRWEDWFFVPYLTGSKQPTLGWLWEPINAPSPTDPEGSFLLQLSGLRIQLETNLILRCDFTFRLVARAPLGDSDDSRAFPLRRRLFPDRAPQPGSCRGFLLGPDICLCTLDLSDGRDSHPDRPPSGSSSPFRLPRGGRQPRDPAPDFRGRARLRRTDADMAHLSGDEAHSHPRSLAKLRPGHSLPGGRHGRDHRPLSRRLQEG